MTLTLKYPPTNPTTTITFDTAMIKRSRKITRTFQEGTLDGNVAAANAGTSLLELTVTFELVDDNGGKTSLEKWDELDNLIAVNNEETMRLELTEEHATNQTQTYDGLMINIVEVTDSKHSPVVKTGKFNFIVTSKGAIT